MKQTKLMNQSLFKAYSKDILSREENEFCRDFGCFIFVNKDFECSSRRNFAFYSEDSLIVFKKGLLQFDGDENKKRSSYENFMYFDYGIEIYLMATRENLWHLRKQGYLNDEEYKSYKFVGKKKKLTPFLVMSDWNNDFPVLHQLNLLLQKAMDSSPEKGMTYVGENRNRKLYTYENSIGHPRLHDTYNICKITNFYDDRESTSFDITISIRNSGTNLSHSIRFFNINEDAVKCMKETVDNFMQDALNYYNAVIVK